MKKLLFSVIALFMIAGTASAQVAVRANLATLPFGVLTVGGEFGLAKKWTLGVDAMINIVNPYDFYEMKGGMLMVEGRYYFCETFNKHHIGAYAYGGYYSEMSLSNKLFSNVIAYCGDNGPHLPNGIEKVRIGFLGLSYGYYLKLAHGWGLDFSIGGGVNIARYQIPEDIEMETPKRTADTNLHFGLNRFAIDLSYKF